MRTPLPREKNSWIRHCDVSFNYVISGSATDIKPHLNYTLFTTSHFVKLSLAPNMTKATAFINGNRRYGPQHQEIT